MWHAWLKGSAEGGQFYLSKHLTFENLCRHRHAHTHSYTHTHRNGHWAYFHGYLTIPQLLDVSGANYSTSLMDIEPGGIVSGHSHSFLLILAFSLAFTHTCTHVHVSTQTHEIIKGPRQPRIFCFTGQWREQGFCFLADTQKHIVTASDKLLWSMQKGTHRQQ